VIHKQKLDYAERKEVILNKEELVVTERKEVISDKYKRALCREEKSDS
jgi:hypothetical protein